MESVRVLYKNGSHLIHDGEKSLGVLIRNLKLTSEVYQSDVTNKFKDKDNLLNPINRIQYLTKRFMKAHGGYDRSNLQDWMNLVYFILSKPSNRFQKIEKIFEIVLYYPQRS